MTASAEGPVLQAFGCLFPLDGSQKSAPASMMSSSKLQVLPVSSKQELSEPFQEPKLTLCFKWYLP
jgi:hypothetical protein